MIFSRVLYPQLESRTCRYEATVDIPIRLDIFARVQIIEYDTV